MLSQMSTVSASPRPDKRLLQPRRRYVSENLDATSDREDFTPLNLQKPWVSVTKLLSSAHKRLSRTKSSSSNVRDDSSITMSGGSKKPILKTLSLTRQKQKHTVDNTALQEFMQDVLHVMKHNTYPPGKGYATVVGELQQVVAAPGGPERARGAWYGHLLPRLAALLTQPIAGISTLAERVPAALALWSNLQGCLAPLLQALWQPLPGMRAERDVVTVFGRHVLPLVSLRGADEGHRDEVLAQHRQRLLDMLLLCSRLSWCSEDCCQQHNRMKDVNFEDQLLNMNNSRLESFGNSATTNGTSSQGSVRKHKTAYRKTSAPSGYLHFRTELIENIDENDELVLQNHQYEHELLQNSNELGNSLFEKDTWRKTSCPAHLATLSALDNDDPPRERFGDGTAAERVDSFPEIRDEGFGGSQTIRMGSRGDDTSTSDYNLSAELSLLFGHDPPACGSAFILANLPSLLRLHHEKE